MQSTTTVSRCIERQVAVLGRAEKSMMQPTTFVSALHRCVEAQLALRVALPGAPSAPLGPNSKIGRDGIAAALSAERSLVDVFIEHRVQLWSIAHKVVGTADLADDVVQEAYLKVVHARTREVDKPFSYCCQVVRNVAVDFCRRHAVESSHRTHTESGDLPQVPCAACPERELDERRTLDAVDKALDAVPARTRRAFELHCLAGLTQREIGQRLGCSATLVNFMVKDARDALAACRARRA